MITRIRYVIAHRLHRRIFAACIVGHLVHGALSLNARTLESVVGGSAAILVAAMHLTEERRER